MSDSKKNSVLFYLFAWTALFGGLALFMFGLVRANFTIYEKGFFFAVLAFGIFAMWALLECYRNKSEGIPVTGTFHGACVVALLNSAILLGIGLWWININVFEVAFYAMAYFCSLVGVICVQKMNRDKANFGASIIELDIPASALFGGARSSEASDDQEKFHGF